MTGPSLGGWVPIRVFSRDGRLFVDWCFFGETRFEEPFFKDTVERCLRRPFNQLFRRQTPVEALAEWRAERPGLAPAGFVFHMSRCGSTLVARMLAALPDSVVLSEASPIDSVLRGEEACGDPAEDDRRAERLRDLLSALGQPRRPGDGRLYVKLDAWATLDLPLIRRAFPEVPWVFLYRDPVEVLVSHLTRRGMHTVPAMVSPALFGLDPVEAVRLPAEEYCARVLAAIGQAALEGLRGGGGSAINYDRLPDAVGSELLPHFGATPTASETERMREAARVDAKNPGLSFVADGARKRALATEAVSGAARRWLADLHATLETR